MDSRQPPALVMSTSGGESAGSGAALPNPDPPPPPGGPLEDIKETKRAIREGAARVHAAEMARVESEAKLAVARAAESAVLLTRA